MDYIKLFIRKFYGNTVKEFVQGPGETIYMPVPPKLYIFAAQYSNSYFRDT